MKKLAPIFVVATLAIVIGIGYMFIPSSDGSKPGNVNVKELPKSLANWYPPVNSGPVYLSRMFQLGGSMIGIIENTRQGDMENALQSYEQFETGYKESANMVPEWRGYYDMKALNDLGEAVRSEDPGAIMNSIPEIGKTCENCHKDQKPYLWAEYVMKDFRKVMIETPEGMMPFPAGKMKYLVVGFDGTMVNAMEGQKDSTADSFGLFKMMFYNMKETCQECHGLSPRHYFVSNDVTDKINDTELQIAAENYGTVLTNMQEIGGECYKCHVVHETLQRIKEQMEKNN